MKNYFRTLGLLLFSLSLIGPIFGQNYVGDEKDINAILKNTAEFSEFVMTSDFSSIVDAYADDARIFPPEVDILTGADAIRNAWTLPEGMTFSHHKTTPQEIRIVDDTAYDYGYYEGRTRDDDGGEMSWHGKYVIVWKKVKGEWKIYLDIWNRIKD